MNDLEFIQHHFGTRTDKSNVLSWQHALNVANVLDEALALSHEHPSDAMILQQAALGHDLLEDTDITREELVSQWSEEVVSLINWVTNQDGDRRFDRYIQQLKQAPDEALVIKYADILANSSNSIECFEILGEKWCREFWVPLLQDYLKQLPATTQKYPQTVSYLRDRIASDTEQLKILIS